MGKIPPNCYVLSENNGLFFHAGSKARNDADIIFKKFGLVRLQNSVANEEQEVRNCLQQRGLHMLKLIKTGVTFLAYRNRIIVAQYPNYGQGLVKHLIHFLFKHNKMIYLVHDVDWLRNLGQDKKDELKLLNSAKVLIIHNEEMEKKLKESGVIQPGFINLRLFDYLIELNMADKKFHKAIVFAGNLGKSKFLSLLIRQSQTYDINLYGIGLKDENSLPERTHYLGSYSPEQLPNVISSGLGLVWDGESINSCVGPMGEYLRYNNPHKLSLYIAAGIPVIVWKEAAVAKIVRQFGIGFCVDSLLEIDDLLENLTETQYRKLCQNVQSLQHKVIKGYYLTAALEKTFAYLATKGEN